MKGILKLTKIYRNEKLLSLSYTFLLPEAGGEGALVDARSFSQGINPENPPPALNSRTVDTGMAAYPVS